LDIYAVDVYCVAEIHVEALAAAAALSYLPLLVVPYIIVLGR